MTIFPTSRLTLLVLGLALLTVAPVLAQQADPSQRDLQRPVRQYDIERPPDLIAQDNLNHVAASAVQIRTVLSKDEGLMVELKRWVAKEATDNGQIVEDAALTDDAIFERLDRDVAFRSVATRLAQRYGYLLPALNPDSAVGKQQEFVLKERARKLVQIESQEDSEALRPRDRQEQASCDSQRDPDCDREVAARGRRKRTTAAEPGDIEPDRNESQGEPNSARSPQVLRADGTRRRTLEQADGTSEPDLLMASNPARRPQDAFPGTSLPTLPLGSDSLAALAGGFATDDTSSALSRAGERTSEENPAPDKSFKATGRMNRERELPMERDLAPVSMVHKPNPYSDIPSLYDMYVQAAPKSKSIVRFGLDVFRNGIEQMDSIPMDIPAGPDYVVGPGDGLSVSMWGSVANRFSRTVDREGRINLPLAGPLLVSGRSLADVQQAAQQLLRTQYRDVSVDVSLLRLRTVRVYVVGDVAAPGAYDISALSTPLNALFEAGGVTASGSLRNLKHYRGNQLIEQVDTYDLLLHGVRGDLQRLENGDTLMVPPIGAQITVDGMVRRPAIYELHGESSLTDALQLAGGILPAAALQHIEVQRLEAHEKRTMLSVDVSPSSNSGSVEAQLASFNIQDGDQIHIFPIAPFNEKVVYLQGHVLRPGRYSYRDGMKLTDVIASYSDLLPEPAGRYGEIVRLNAPDFHPSVESFDLTAALANPAVAPKLQPLDTIRIFSRFDFEQAPAVWVGGAVRVPGNYRTSGQAHLRDAVYLAGGILPDASLGSAQLFRTEADGTMKILSVNLSEALTGNPLDNIILEPRDRLLIHRNTERVEPATVFIKGEVAKPGRYPLTGNMHVEDLIRVAGGLKRSADPQLADLTTHADADALHTSTASVDVSLTAALDGDTKGNLLLHDGDVLTVRQKPGWNDLGAMIAVKGEVQHPGTYGIKPGERLSSILQRAGGFDSQAYPYGAILMRREVRDLELKSRVELIQRIKTEQVSLKALPETDQDQKNSKLTALAQTDTVLTQLQEAMPVGRVVVHIRPEINKWRNTVADVPVRDGDVLLIPKKADYVTVTGQVFNSTAVSYQPGRSAKWYLSQAGGFTPLADKAAVFVIRGDGSVIAARNNSGWLAGNPLHADLRPGDSIIVPEKAPKIGGKNFTTLIQTAQVASSIAFAVAALHP